MKTTTDIDRRIATLQYAIAINEQFLATVPSGADPKTVQRIARDREELAKLRSKQEAA